MAGGCPQDGPRWVKFQLQLAVQCLLMNPTWSRYNGGNFAKSTVEVRWPIYPPRVAIRYLLPIYDVQEQSCQTCFPQEPIIEYWGCGPQKKFKIGQENSTASRWRILEPQIRGRERDPKAICSHVPEMPKYLSCSIQLTLLLSGSLVSVAGNAFPASGCCNK